MPQLSSTPVDDVPLAPQQPWLHHLEIAVHGNVTALSGPDGDMGSSATGLFVDDRRVLAVLGVLADDRRPSPVSASSMGERTTTMGSFRRLGTPGPDPTVDVVRERVVVDGGLSEVTKVTNRSSSHLRARLSVVLAGDGAPLSTVKAGKEPPALLPAVLGTDPDAPVVSWSDDRHLTCIDAVPPPGRVTAGTTDKPSSLEWQLDLAPGRCWSLELRVSTNRLTRTVFDADPAAHLLGWDDVRVEAGDQRLGPTIRASLTDLRQLAMSDPLAPDDVFVGAGSPWYLTLFGRDCLWAARLTLPFGTQLAAGTLRTLARRQGRVDNPATAEQPGRILHEVRRNTDPSTYYGTVDATALWVCLLHDAWRHGMDVGEVRELLPAMHAALSWLRRGIASEDGLLRYVDETGVGLANQGWKDSGDSMRRADGSIACAPIALLEAQAYAVEALGKAAALLTTLCPDDGAAATLLAEAEALAARVRERFWVQAPGGRYLAMALDGDGRQVDGVGSNMGHVLTSGVLTAAETDDVVATLTGPDLLGPYGISTLSRSNPAYNPIGYHTGSTWTHDTAVALVGLSAVGAHGPTVQVARALVESAAAFGYRWPELCAGDPVLGRPAPYPASCRPQGWSAASAGALVTAVLGLRVDAPARTVRLAPLPLDAFGPVRVQGLRLGDHVFAAGVDWSGSVQVTGLPDDVTVIVDGHSPGRAAGVCRTLAPH